MKITLRHGLLQAVMLLLCAPGLLPARPIPQQAPPPQPAPVEPAKPTAQAEPPANPPATKEKQSKPKKPGKKQKKHTPSLPAPDAPRKVIVKEGGASETPTEVTPKIEPAKANYERESTTGLIAATEKNLELLKDFRLSKDQKATVEQIRLFLQQARDAFKQSDFGRAHTLAMKARLLSDDLLPH